MFTYETNAPFVKLYETSDAMIPKRSLGGVAGSRFVGDGSEDNGRQKVTREGETTPEWWVVTEDLDVVAAEELHFELPRLVDAEFFEDASLAARAVSGFRDAGGMNAEYLLLLAWAESGWTNSDTEGRDGEDAELDGKFGPFRFDKATWKKLLQDRAYEPILRGFTEGDRLAPEAQCFFAACLANCLQGALVAVLGGEEPAAWLLRVGHRIGETATLRFAQLNADDSVSTKVDGVTAVPPTLVNANKKLFTNGSASTKAQVLAAVKAEFNSGRKSILERLGALVQESILDGLKRGSPVGGRLGALGLLDFIARFESGGNYNAVVDRSKNENNPRLTSMSISEVLSFQQRLGTRNASGKYQIIQSTLGDTKGKVGLSDSDLFDADTQDKLALELLMVRRGGKSFQASAGSQSDIEDFALSVAKEWAAMPVLTATTGHNSVQIERGDSYYKGTAGNTALTRVDAFESAIQKFKAEA